MRRLLVLMAALVLLGACSSTPSRQAFNGLANPFQTERLTFQAGTNNRFSASDCDGWMQLTREQRAAKEFDCWVNVGGDPYRGGTYKEALASFTLPAAVKAKMAERIEKGESGEIEFGRGDFFRQMVFGPVSNGKAKAMENVIAAWKPDEKHRATMYTVQDGGNTYRLYMVLDCGNWAWDVHESTAPAPADDRVNLPPIAEAPPMLELPRNLPVVTGGLACVSTVSMPFWDWATFSPELKKQVEDIHKRESKGIASANGPSPSVARDLGEVLWKAYERGEIKMAPGKYRVNAILVRNNKGVEEAAGKLIPVNDGIATSEKSRTESLFRYCPDGMTSSNYIVMIVEDSPFELVYPREPMNGIATYPGEMKVIVDANNRYTQVPALVDTTKPRKKLIDAEPAVAATPDVPKAADAPVA